MRVSLRLLGIFGFATALITSVISMGSVHDSRPGFLGAFRVTYYYVAAESDYSIQNRIIPVLTPEGDEIARVSAAFKKAFDIEGTAKLLDGRVFNYVSHVGKDIRYRLTDAPYGLGVKKCELIPFHSIAVDPKRIPLGSLVHISKTEGMILPDGSKHNGLWYAHDIGGAIKNDRVDLFVGAGKVGGITLDHANIGNLEALDVTLVEAPTSDSCVFKDDPTPSPSASASPSASFNY